MVLGRRTIAPIVALGLCACGGGDRDGGSMPAADGGAGEADAGPTGLPLLGGGTHSLDEVDFEVIATEPLNVPRDLAINPDDPSQLWVVNNGDNSATIFLDVGTADQDWRRRISFGSDHFHSKVASIAFGAPGTLATAQDEDEVTQSTTPADFMGPTLWPSDLEIFDAGHSSHLDMLHNSPSSVGIAWERDNVYWVFDGHHGSITRYDFQGDHGHGGADHSDGIIARYVEGAVSYVDGVGSHLAFDGSTSLLYVADTGNSRIAVLDTTTGTRGAAIGPDYDGAEMYAVDGASIETLVDGEAVDMPRPSGLALREGLLYVTDNGTSRILAFDLEGQLVDWLDLSPEIGDGGLQGIDFDPDGRLYLVDSSTHRVLRIAPRK